MRVWEGTPTSLPHASPHPRPDPIEWSEIPDEEVGAPLARPGSPARRRMLIRDLARAQGVKVTLRGMCALPTCSANGGQHGTLCPAKACALISFGPHSKLFQRCTGFEKREHGLWKAGDHQPAAWYSFPAEEELDLRGITLPPEYVGRSLGSVGRQPTAAARAAAPSSGCRHQRRRTPTRTRRSRTRTPAAYAGWRSRPTRGGGHGGHGQRCCSGSSATAARASVGSTSSACPSLQWTATATGSALLALPLPTRRMTRATCSRRMCTRDAVAQRASEQTCAWLSVRRTIHLSSIVLVQYACCRTKVALLMMSRHRGSVEARHGRTHTLQRGLSREQSGAEP